MNKSHNLLLLLMLIHSGLIAQVLVKNTNVLDIGGPYHQCGER